MTPGSHSTPAATWKERLACVVGKRDLVGLEIVQLAELHVIGEEELGEASNTVARRLGALVVVERLDRRDEVGHVLLELPLHDEARPTHHDDVRPAVRQRLVHPHFGHTAYHSRVGSLLLRARRRDTELPVAGEAIRQQAAIARLEDVQRKRRAGEEDDGEREQRKAHVAEDSMGGASDEGSTRPGAMPAEKIPRFARDGRGYLRRRLPFAASARLHGRRPARLPGYAAPQ